MLIECQECEAKVRGIEHGDYMTFGPNDDEPYRFTLLECPECHSPIVAIQDQGGDTQWGNPLRCLPEAKQALPTSVPASIRASFAEALSAYRAKAYTASAIMCGKSLEAMCKEHNVKANTLAGGLKELKTRGIIEERLLEWSEAVKTVRNQAAHELSPNISKRDAKDLLEFSEAILQYVFTFADQFAAFQKRR